MTIHYWVEPDPFIKSKSMDRTEREYSAVEYAIANAKFVRARHKNILPWKQYLECLEDKLIFELDKK
jgi:hypothetical protein